MPQRQFPGIKVFIDTIPETFCRPLKDCIWNVRNKINP